MHKYPMQLYWSEDDDAFIVEVPDLLGCSADGPTPEEAVKEAQAAIDRWLWVAREEGWKIPECSSRPLQTAS